MQSKFPMLCLGPSHAAKYVIVGGEEKQFTMQLDDRRRYHMGITVVPFIAILLPRLHCGPTSWSNMYIFFIFYLGVAASVKSRLRFDVAIAGRYHSLFFEALPHR
jgi:hypothetical protein